MLTAASPLSLPSGVCENLPHPSSNLPARQKASQCLGDRRILVVEDDYMVAMDLAEALQEAGATVLGPVPDLGRAFDTLRGKAPAGAILDVRLGEETVYSLADRLRELDVAFLLITALDPEDLPPRHADAPFCAKPLDTNVAVAALGRLMTG